MKDDEECVQRAHYTQWTQYEMDVLDAFSYTNVQNVWAFIHRIHNFWFKLRYLADVFIGS